MLISDWSSDVCSSDVCSSDLPSAAPVPIETAERNMHVSCGWARAGAGQLALDRRRTWTTSPVPELAAVVREREHQRPALDMVARVRLPIPAIAGVDDIALGLPVAGCSLRRSEEHTSELQSLMRISYAVFCFKKKNNINNRYQCHI